MSRSKPDTDRPNRFDDWLREEFRRTDGFTALVVLVAISDLSITPLRSTYFHVIGDEIDWSGVSGLLAGSGIAWDGALFSSRSAVPAGGPVQDVVARHELQELTERLMADRLVLNKNHFFDRRGRRLKVEEVAAH